MVLTVWPVTGKVKAVGVEEAVGRDFARILISVENCHKYVLEGIHRVICVRKARTQRHY